MMTGKVKEDVKWYLRPVSILILLFIVLGPFALPLLYKSPMFGRKWKIILTIIVISYTGYIIIMSWQVIQTISGVTEGF